VTVVSDKLGDIASPFSFIKYLILAIDFPFIIGVASFIKST
jgi:hypothetical protein